MRVAIVGAGIAGLTVAHAVKREAGRRGAPIDLAVFEAGPRAGGRIHTISDSGFLIETAADAFRTGAGPARSLVTDLGLDGERVEASPEASRRYVYAGSRLHLLPAGPASLLRFKAISPAGRLRVLAEPLFARRASREESVHDYAARHIGGEAARVMLGTFVRGVYAGDSTKLSVDAAFPRMRELERRHRSLVIAMIKERREIRREGKTLWSLKRGMGSVIDRMAESLGPSIRKQMPALTLTRLPEYAARTPFTLRFASGDALSYDAVVISTPPAEAAALLREIDRESANSLREIPCAGVAMVALAFRAESFRAKPDGYGFLVAPGEDLPILGALF